MGVGRVEGFTVFVEGALPEETVIAKIVKIQKTFAYGKLIEIDRQSQSRVTPSCGIVSKCGGCQLQHLDYKAQLHNKTQMVKDVMERIGGFKDLLIHDAIGMEDPWRYRNKAQFPVGFTKDVVIGFYANRSHDIIDTDKCVIQDKLNDKVIKVFKEYIRRFSIPVYNEATHKGLVRHIVTRKGFKTGEVMVCIVVNGENLPETEYLVEKLISKVPEIKSIVLNINKRQSNVILGANNITIYGEGAIFDYIGKFKFRISPNSFFQVNPVQTDVLYSKALEYAALTGNETVFDAYCGIGTISLFLSEKAKKVYGVEVVSQAIQNAKENAVLNNVDNVEFILGESEKVIPEMHKKGIKADVIVVDPPRKGCEQELLDVIVEMQCPKVVYVSCNPATLARDMKFLVEKGYVVKEVQ
ncbi:MAG: rRNA (uracil-5-)-methyltransferase RumA, partial [Clostridia bacterium]|nr:rRNA (uracil-5-)-methyltransferase RumA [Clostridia bacterium]